MEKGCLSSAGPRPWQPPGFRRAWELQRQARVLRALGHSARLEIVEMLRGGERCVCEIEPALGRAQPNVSQHLAILRAANLVAARRDGQRMMYRLADPSIPEVLDRVAGIVRQQRAGLAEGVPAATVGTA